MFMTSFLLLSSVFTLFHPQPPSCSSSTWNILPSCIHMAPFLLARRSMLKSNIFCEVFSNNPIYKLSYILLLYFSPWYVPPADRVYVRVYYLPPFTVKFPNSRVFVCFVHCCILMVQNSDNHILAVQYIFVNKVISICKSLHCMWPNKEYNLELYNIFK